MAIVKKMVKALMAFLALGFLVTSVLTPVFGENIKVGVILPLTGKLSELGGEIEHKSFLMATEEINSAGGINGEKIELIFEDTAGIRDVGRSAMEKLITQDKVIVVGGGFSSSVAWAASNTAQQFKVPFLINTASADRITESEQEYTFRLNPPVSEYPKRFATFMRQVAVDTKTVALLYEKSLFGQLGAKKFLKQCNNVLGIDVIMREGYEAGAVDFRPLMAMVKAKEPDLIYVASHVMEASLLMQIAKELDVNPKLFVGWGAGFALPEFKNRSGDVSEYVLSASLWTPSVPYPGAKDFHRRFVMRYDLFPEYHGAQAYAGMYGIADALKRAKSLTPEDVRDALTETDMMTVFGPVKFISYREKTQQNRIPTILVQWLNGKLETVWPRQVSTAGYVYPAPKWDER